MLDTPGLSSFYAWLEEPIRTDHRHLLGRRWFGYPILKILLECSKFGQSAGRITDAVGLRLLQRREDALDCRFEVWDMFGFHFGTDH